VLKRGGGKKRGRGTRLSYLPPLSDDGESRGKGKRLLSEGGGLEKKKKKEGGKGEGEGQYTVLAFISVPSRSARSNLAMIKEKEKTLREGKKGRREKEGGKEEGKILGSHHGPRTRTREEKKGA